MRLTSFGDRSLPEWPSHLFRHLPLGVRSWIINRYKTSAFEEPGTINNQHHREEAILHILKAFHPDAIVETGVYLGAGTKFFLTHTKDCPVFSCEIQDFYYDFCVERFKNMPQAHLHKGSSVDFLRHVSYETLPQNANVLFYLDAHWQKYLPLRDECSIITERWPEALTIVDDFAVPNDKGYRFDDYGRTGTLNANYLKGINANLRIFYPAASSKTETGGKRGAGFLCFPDTKAYRILSENPALFIEAGLLG